jgi:hypothetical protein
MNNIKQLINIVFILFTILIGNHPATASSENAPIITLSFGKPYLLPETSECYPAYIIKIFENGHVEYQGINKIKIIGKREYKMDKVTLKALIKKFQDENVIARDDRISLPESLREYYDLVAYIGISFRQGSQETTIFRNPPLRKLKSDIIKATKAERWGVNEVSFCHGDIK